MKTAVTYEDLGSSPFKDPAHESRTMYEQQGTAQLRARD